MGRAISTVIVCALTMIFLGAPGLSRSKLLQTLPKADAFDRLYHHYRYDVSTDKLEKIDDRIGNPDGVKGKHCYLQPVVATALRALLAAADAEPKIAGTLRAISCFRDAGNQDGLFCNEGRLPPPCTPPEVRAYTSAPPGFSEHGTGYALDFAIRPSPAICLTDVDPCFEQTDQAKWLLAHAREFGFELSFPCKAREDVPTVKKHRATTVNVCLSGQRVMYEPWHWRWVGSNGTARTASELPIGAAAARKLFACARKCFAATPGIDPVPLGASETDVPFLCPPPDGH